MDCQFEHQDDLYIEMESTTSPWTELYQDETPPAASAESRMGQHQETAPESEAEQPTHDALSAIFNGH